MKIPFAIRSGKRNSILRGLSIQQRLPLLICILLLSVMLVFGFISYISVRRETLNTGRERLQSLSDQLSSMLSQSSQALVTANRNVSNDPAIKKYLTSLSSPPGDAIAALQKLKRDSASVLMELLDKNFNVALREQKNNISDKVPFHLLRAAVNISDTGRPGKLIALRDSLYYPVITAVTDQGSIIGYLLRWRIVLNSSATVERLNQLIGPQSNLYFANNDYSLWTNMSKPVPPPLPKDVLKSGSLHTYEKNNGQKYEAAIKPIHNTPWLIMVEFTEKTMLGSANSFLRWVIIIGTLLIIAGIFVAWLMSRNITRPLNNLTVAASAIANGNYTTQVPLDRRDEVGKLARAFNAMSTQINKAKESLEMKVTESGVMNEQLRELTNHLQNIREDERKHIAREMHDELGQFLTGLKMDLGWLRKKMPANPDTAHLQEKLNEMSTLVDEAVLFVRKLAAELRPSILDDLGLIAALEWHSQEFTRRFNIPVEFHSQVKDLPAPASIATGLFRMYQESLTNVARHASARKVSANLMVSNSEIHLTIQDDGIGFDMDGTSEGKTLGLLGMKERALMIGGKLDIISKPGQGTIILINVPLKEVIAPVTIG